MFLFRLTASHSAHDINTICVVVAPVGNVLVGGRRWGRRWGRRGRRRRKMATTVCDL